MKVKLLNNIKRYFQNSSDEKDIIYRQKSYKYFPFKTPPLPKLIGEQSESLSIILPLVSAAEYDYFPLKEWSLSGDLDGMTITFTIFDLKNLMVNHTFTLDEQNITRTDNKSNIELILRQIDSSDVNVMTKVYSYKNIGEPPTYSAY